MSSFAQTLTQFAWDLRDLGIQWALVGGFAVSVRAIPRTTLDLDLVIAVDSDHEAEQLVLDLKARGYGVDGLHVEQDTAGRLAMARLLASTASGTPTVVDLLFASSGIEREIASAAELLAILPGVEIPVAQIGHLLALKLLAGRDQDLVDARALLRHAAATDRVLARESLTLIERRGFDRGRSGLQAELTGLIQDLEMER